MTHTRLQPSASYLDPKRFADYLVHQHRGKYEYGLFLDIDGTLAHFTQNPADSVIAESTLVLLQKIQRCGVYVAAITGRSLSEARQMLAPVQIPIAATHGLEIASDAKQSDHHSSGLKVDIAELVSIKEAIAHACINHQELMIEDKPYSVALHFRGYPMLADTARQIMTTLAKRYANWTLKPGKFVWELMPKGADKGAAIVTLLDQISADKPLYPIFIGDDVTDEAGFAAVQSYCLPSDSSPYKDNEKSPKESHKHCGMGIKVGLAPTCAMHYVNDIDEVAVLLKSFLILCQKNTDSLPDITKNHHLCLKQ